MLCIKSRFAISKAKSHVLNRRGKQRYYIAVQPLTIVYCTLKT